MLFKKEITKDILLCKEILENKDVISAERKLNQLVAAYDNYIPAISNGLILYDSSREPDYLQDLEVMKRRLELLRSVTLGQNPTKYTNTPKIEITNKNENVNKNENANNNLNVNKINLEVLIQQTRDNIESNEFLSETEREEILNKLCEIEDIHKSDITPNQKWGKLKSAMNWLETKGIAVARELLPLIIAIISNNN